MKRFVGDFTLVVNQKYNHMEVEIFGVVNTPSGQPTVIGYDGNYLVEQQVTRENEMSFDFKPLLRVGMFQFEPIVKAFVNYANEKNIHTEVEDHLKGKLEATETHLADMREMSKKLVDTLIKKVK